MRGVWAGCVIAIAVAVSACSSAEDEPPAGADGERSGVSTQSDDAGHRRDARAERRRARRRAAERKRRERAGRTAVVSDVIDGDTIELAGIGRVRLIGVDTPERGEDCYEEATDYLRDRIGWQPVRYRYQADHIDPYDRTLLDIYSGGELVNLDIAEAGWGEEMTIAPNDRHAYRIAAAEDDARSAGRGKWAGCGSQVEDEPDSPAPTKPQQLDREPDSGNRGGGGGGALPPPPPDLDCSDVDGPVEVGPGDPHRLDADGDGTGCDG